MGFVKCPRCELNYILDGGNLCTVCRKEVCGDNEPDELAELCSECGENPVAHGSELCAACFKEMARRVAADSSDEDDISPEETTLEIDSVSTMDEIAIDLDDTLEGEVFEDDEFDNDDTEDEDDEDDGDILDR